MTACERVLEYTHLPSEDEYLLSLEEPSAEDTAAGAPRALIVDPSPSWPAEGGIEFRNLSLRFAKELPFVLQDVSCTVRPHEKIGVSAFAHCAILMRWLTWRQPRSRLLVALGLANRPCWPRSSVSHRGQAKF